MEAVKRLRKDVNKKVTDTFEVGTVIRWTAAGRYTYVALKTAVGWFTTASSTNRLVPPTLDYEDLVEILARSESSDIEYATAWESVL